MIVQPSEILKAKPTIAALFFECRLCVECSAQAIESIRNAETTPELTREQIAVVGKLVSQCEEALAALQEAVEKL